MEHKMSGEQAFLKLRRKEKVTLMQLLGVDNIADADNMDLMFGLMYLYERRNDSNLKWNDFDPTVEEVIDYFDVDVTDTNLTQ